MSEPTDRDRERARRIAEHVPRQQGPAGRTEALPYEKVLSVARQELAAARAEGEAAGYERGVRQCAELAANRARNSSLVYDDLRKVASNPEDMGVLKHAAWAGEAERIEAFIRALLPTGDGKETKP